MANNSILAAFERMWQHVIAALDGKASASDVDALQAEVDTKATTSDLTNHVNNKSNPHGVTLAQLGVTATAAEVNYIDGVTSNVQSQFGSLSSEVADKMDKANPTGTGSLSLNRKADTTVGTNSVAEGSSTTASGNNSHAEGAGTIASGTSSHAEGRSTTASGKYSHAEGYSSHAEDDYSHAEGYYSHAEFRGSHAEGSNSHAEGHFSHAEGFYTHAEGFYSHAEGSNSHAEGYSSHAEGYSSHAEGSFSHAEGDSTTASGNCSHAEGLGSEISCNITGDANTTTYTIDNTNSLIIGASIRYEVSNNTYNTAKIIAIDEENKTITTDRTLSSEALSDVNVNIRIAGLALGNNSHVEGSANIAAGCSQHVQGEYNIIDPEYDVNDSTKRGKYAHIVGNGDYNTRSNAHTLDWDGNAWFAGKVTIGPDNKELATKDDIANKAPAYTYGTTDLEAGTSALETGKLYFVYE